MNRRGFSMKWMNSASSPPSLCLVWDYEGLSPAFCLYKIERWYYNNLISNKLINNKGDVKTRWDHLTICLANEGTKNEVQHPVGGSCEHIHSPMNLTLDNKPISVAMTVTKMYVTPSNAQMTRKALSGRLVQEKYLARVCSSIGFGTPCSITKVVTSKTFFSCPWLW